MGPEHFHFFFLFCGFVMAPDPWLCCGSMKACKDHGPMLPWAWRGKRAHFRLLQLLRVVVRGQSRTCKAVVFGMYTLCCARRRLALGGTLLSLSLTTRDTRYVCVWCVCVGGGGGFRAKMSGSGSASGAVTDQEDHDVGSTKQRSEPSKSSVPRPPLLDLVRSVCFFLCVWYR